VCAEGFTSCKRSSNGSTTNPLEQSCRSAAAGHTFPITTSASWPTSRCTNGSKKEQLPGSVSYSPGGAALHSSHIWWTGMNRCFSSPSEKLKQFLTCLLIPFTGDWCHVCSFSVSVVCAEGSGCFFKAVRKGSAPIGSIHLHRQVSCSVGVCGSDLMQTVH